MFAPASLDRLFSYGSEGLDDSGWGCVYRSFQNALLHTGYRVPGLMTLLENVGLEWGDWSEPSQFKDLAKTKAMLAGHSKKWLKYTHESDYDIILDSVEDLENKVWKLGGSCAFVVDDGVSGYAIVPIDGVPHWIDPHTSIPRRLKFKNQLQRSTGWMVLQVCPRRQQLTL